MADQDPSVRNAPDHNRFEVHVGDDLAGFTEYVDDGGQRIFFHTEIGEQFGGRGLAGILVKAALTQTRADGKRIVPVCPFVAGYLRKHDDFADIADAVTPAALQKVKDFTAGR